MPRRLSVEERIKRLEENRKFAIERAVRSINAIYDARIALLLEKGLPKRGKRLVPRSLEEMAEKGKDRYVFFRTKFYEFMGLSPEEAHVKAEREYETYRKRWLKGMKE